MFGVGVSHFRRVPRGVGPALVKSVLMQPTRLRLALVLAATAVLLSACGGGGDESSSGGSAGGDKGGTYRVGWENSFGFTDNFDPTGEYLGDAQGIHSSLLVRTLVGYDHVAGIAGNKLVPDLATEVPEPTDDGQTYTFKLKDGIKFGPPVSRPITSKDVLYALERLAVPKNGGQYAFYYSVIRGFDDYGAGKATTISGIETPDDRTVVFHLTKPTGDFLFRMGMPATGPIPEEVAKCFDGKPGRYGSRSRLERPVHDRGRGRRDASSCSALKPMSGFDQTHLTLVRNPDYDPAPTRPLRARACPTASSGRSTRTPTTSSARCRRASSRTRCRPSRRRCCAGTSRARI